jgi:cobalamin biosynthetic protein CobC
VPAPGSQALIQWLPRLFERCRVTVIGPTYGGHALAWALGGHIVGEVATADQVPADSAVVVVVNPNNPDGRIIDADRLLLLTGDRTVIVDEAFADVTPEVSVAGHVTSPACRGTLIVLRSVGKFFGLAGMRLGFALVHGALSEKLRQALGPWAVSGPAAAVGAVALQDDVWIRAARVRLTATSGRLDGLLVRNGFDVIGGTALFRLVEHVRAADLFEHLAQAAILTRAFDHQPFWLRLGLPGNDGEFERLAEALSLWRPRAAASATPGTRRRG